MKYDFEIIVVDTGSSDDSIETAKKFTDKVYSFNWINDFAAARNYAIEQATNEYILSIDTDEFIDEINEDELYCLINDHPNDVAQVHIKNLYQSDDSEMVSNELITRLFPKSSFHYKGTIHEQITPRNNDRLSYNIYSAPVYITHAGYKLDNIGRNKKAERNLNLLLQEHESNPDDTYILYQIGKTYFFCRDYSNAIAYFEKAIEYPLDTKLIYVRQLIVSYAYSMIYLKQYSKAVALEVLYDDLTYCSDYLFVMGLIYMNNARFDDAVNAFLNATAIKDSIVEGVNSYIAFYNIGVIYECLGRTELAVSYYEKCGNYKPAKAGLVRCINSSSTK